MGKKWIGVDVGGTSVKLGIFDVDGVLLKKWEIPTRKEEQGKYVLDDIAASIRETLKDENISMEEVVGVGIDVPGPVKKNGYVEVCVNLGWRDIYPAKELSARLDGIPAECGNDANAAALGEMWKGGGEGYSDIVMVTLGTGVGGGVIINEKIIAGRHGLGGEIGHIHARDDEQEYCNCGGRGCLEQVASATGIAREARRKMAADERPSVLRQFGDEVTAKDVLDGAKAGDALALEVAETACHYLGVALAQAALIVDPDIFIIGGGVSKAGQFLVDMIKKHYEEHITISADHPLIGLATLGNDAGIYGAARMVLK